jgi:riboflavin kinase / FMN adenylyltransferase
LSTATVLKEVDAVAIGGFDGMHIGHQHLFRELGEHGAVVVIETGYANLTPGRERERYTRYPVVYYPLDAIRHYDGEAFVKELKRQFPKLSRIVVGYDFHFGKDRRYSPADLDRIFDGEVVVIAEVCVHNDSVHSHKIRAKIQIGDIAGANTFLGHNYTIQGSVVTGQGIGKRELVPTINVATDDGYLLPKEGVYATLTRIDDEEHYYPSVSFIGHRVTTDGSFAVETHVIGEEVACRREVSISFVAFLRDNERFDSLEALKAVIDLDIKRAATTLKHLSL